VQSAPNSAHAPPGSIAVKSLGHVAEQIVLASVRSVQRPSFVATQSKTSSQAGSAAVPYSHAVAAEVHGSPSLGSMSGHAETVGTSLRGTAASSATFGAALSPPKPPPKLETVLEHAVTASAMTTLRISRTMQTLR
jgi:hypothetical protein